MASTNFTDNSTVIAASWLDDVDVATYSALSSVAGTNTITATGPVPMSAYATGQLFRFIPANTNTGATTINITPSGGSALGAKNIFNNGSALTGGEIKAGVPCLIYYDGTQFNIIGPYLGKDAARPAFLVTKTTQSNVTADGTAKDVSWETEIYDQANNFATPSFTAPVTGKYRLEVSLRLEQLDTAATYFQVMINTSNRTYQQTFDPARFSADVSYWSVSMSALADMDAGDTAKVQFLQSGGASQVDIVGSSATVVESWFSGSLGC